MGILIVNIGFAHFYVNYFSYPIDSRTCFYVVFSKCVSMSAWTIAGVACSIVGLVIKLCQNMEEKKTD